MSSKITGSMPSVGERSFPSLMAELRETESDVFSPAPAKSFTIGQYAEANGLDRNTAQRRIDALVALGRIKHVGTFSGRAGVGCRLQFLRHYILIKK